METARDASVLVYALHGKFWLLPFAGVSRGSSVGIATDYGLDGPGSNPGGDQIFRPSRRVYRVFPGGKGRPVRASDHSPPRGHGSVQLYLYPPSGPHRARNGITLPLPFTGNMGQRHQ